MAATYFAENDFWCQVLGCSAQRPRPAFDSFGESEVCDLPTSGDVSALQCSALKAATYFEITLTVDQKVFGLQVPVDEVQVVKIFKG